MEASLGIFAFGSLMDDPGAEIEAALVGRKLNVRTPFGVEFARSSTARGGAPTLVPLEHGGAPVFAQILLVSVSEQEAKDQLWRREIDRVGQGGHYALLSNPGPNKLIIDRYENFEGVSVVLAARFAATIVPLTPAGIGTEQVMLVYVLSGQASRSALLSLSVGMKTILSTLNVVLGMTALVLMLRTLRWRHLVEEDTLRAE